MNKIKVSYLPNSKSIGIWSSCLCLFKKLPQPVYPIYWKMSYSTPSHEKPEIIYIYCVKIIKIYCFKIIFPTFKIVFGLEATEKPLVTCCIKVSEVKSYWKSHIFLCLRTIFCLIIIRQYFIQIQYEYVGCEITEKPGKKCTLYSVCKKHTIGDCKGLWVTSVPQVGMEADC